MVAAAGNHGEPPTATDDRPAPTAALFPAALDDVVAAGAVAPLPHTPFRLVWRPAGGGPAMTDRLTLWVWYMP